MVNDQAVTILLVEDDEIDAEAILRAFKKHQITNPVTIARDGIEALNYLRGDSGTKAIARPYLILLDLNMPRMTGFEFLTALRADPAIADSIVFVLTTSDLDEDKITAYEHHVAGYAVKSRLDDSFAELATMVKAFEQIIEFPPPHPQHA